LSIFRSITDAEKKLEAIDVINGEYFLYTLAGKPHVLTARDGRLSIVETSEGGENPNLARRLLEATAKIVLSKHVYIVTQLSHYSVQDLARIVGFSRHSGGGATAFAQIEVSRRTAKGQLRAYVPG
jgi:hypothetical protein